jgi:two-component system cell cycle sensor histidine kinase/response regulator CckA
VACGGEEILEHSISLQRSPMNKPTPSRKASIVRDHELELVQTTIDAIGSPAALVNFEGKILTVNQSWNLGPPTRAANVKTACKRIGAGGAWKIDPEEVRRFMVSLEEVLAGTRESCVLTPGAQGEFLIQAGSLRLNKVAALIVFAPSTARGRRARRGEQTPALPQSVELEIDSLGKILDWNTDARILFGRGEQETVGEHISVLFARKEQRFPSKELLESLRKGQSQQVELRLQAGEGKFLDAVLTLSMKTDRGKARISCQVDVFSDRQRAAGALRRSEERLRYALEAASDGLWDWDLKSDDVVFSPRVSEIFGESPSAEGPRTGNIAAWESRIHPGDAPDWKRQLKAHLADANPTLESEHRIRAENGSWTWVMVRGRVTERTTSGEPLRMIGTITDISERKRAQEALSRSEQQYRGLFEHASDAIILFDPKTGRIRDANDKAEQLLGYRSDVFKEMLVRDLHPSDQWDRIESALARSESETSSLFEVDGLTSDGKRVPLEINTRLVSYEDRFVYQSFMRDISERRVLEQQLRQSQKMETVGRLAGGVAHDFNNLLTAIQGYTVLLQTALPEGGEEREMTEEVLSAVQRASRLTTQLLTFSRHEIPNLVPIDLNAIVEDMQRLLGRLIGEHVQLETSLDPALGQVQGDRGKIEQVVTNLVINGADAMQDGGMLRIETKRVHVDSKQSPPGTKPAQGDYALLSVQDEGQGMDSETLSQVFEPFFTTKPAGSGTGLGLATVYGIVKQTGGHISVKSEPGRGTTFQVYFPIRAEGPAQVDEKPHDPAATGKETVLLVEDEPAVRNLTRRFLESSGYTVIEAGSVADAIRAAEDSSARIDLLLTDVIMPEVSGPELAKRLQALLPTLKVLYMSGYPGDFIARHGVSNTETAYLQKPFSQEDLRGKLRKVLDS